MLQCMLTILPWMISLSLSIQNFHALIDCFTKLSKVQKLQNGAAKIVANSPFDSSATSLIQELGQRTIGEVIHRETSILAYKCLNKLARNTLGAVFLNFLITTNVILTIL